MTTAKLLNCAPVNGMVGTQVDGNQKLQEENLEVASVFSALMNQQVELSDSMLREDGGQIAISQTEGVSDATNSYERYNYKDNKIEVADEVPMEEKIEEATEEVQEFEEKALEMLSEEYGVDEETIQNVLDEMGLSVLDLLNPENLVKFVMELTGVSSAEELLLDQSFLTIMESFDAMATDLMNELNLTPTEFDALVAQMSQVEQDVTEVISFEQELDNQMTQYENSEINPTNETTEDTVAVVMTEETKETEVANNTEVVEENVTAEELVEKDEQSEEDSDEKVKVTVEKQENISTSEETSSETETDAFAKNDDSTPFSNTDSNENLVMSNNTVVHDTSFDVSKLQMNSYTSVDTVQIMEQIAEQVRIIADTNTTTMEMQLNPENLGKVYLHISSEEGVVNAQFTATNEVVKEALEAQIATLRENLTQAGVKVDAIEVTIASHEFEQNLEQNQKQNDELDKHEDGNTKRRNLNLNSLDELSGLMTEEETLVAQMMRENGNSVDLTA